MTVKTETAEPMPTAMARMNAAAKMGLREEDRRV
jgi:hypothetical protein